MFLNPYREIRRLRKCVTMSGEAMAEAQADVILWQHAAVANGDLLDRERTAYRRIVDFCEQSVFPVTTNAIRQIHARCTDEKVTA